MDSITETKMDNIFTDLILETNVTSNNLNDALETIVEIINCSKLKWLFFRLIQNKLTFGNMHSLRPKMVKYLQANGCYYESSSLKQSIVKLYKENNKVYIVSFSGMSVIVTQDEMLALLGREIKRTLKEQTVVKRRIDFDMFIALSLSIVDNFHNNEKGDNCSKETLPGDENVQDRDNSHLTSNANPAKVRKTVSKLSQVIPRQSHTTTFIDLEIVAFPNDRQTFMLPKHSIAGDSTPSQTVEKYSTEVTEVDAGQISFEPNFGHMTSGTSRQHTSIGQEHVYSAQDLPRSSQTPNYRNIVSSGTRIPFNAKPSRYPEFMEQRQRLASFSTPKWCLNQKPDIVVLADNGFFFTGNDDLVRCHQCGIGLKDWVSEDDVLTEHVKHSSSCDFLNHKYGKDEIQRIKVAVTDENNEVTSTASSLPYKIRSPRYQTMEARLASFKDFPKRDSVSPQQLAVAGLYFTGTGDLCRCFTCDGGLKDWSPGDDPIKEHATYFPTCSYIIQLKGTEYVNRHQQQIQQRREPMGASGGASTVTQPTQSTLNLSVNQMTIADNEYSSFNVSQIVQKLGYAEVDVILAKAELERKGNKEPTAEDVVNTLLDMQERAEQSQAVAAPPEGEDLQALEEENKTLSRLIYCMLCITGEADVLFLPCTHHRTCLKCAADLTYCPVCNAFIEEKVKTFRA